MSASSSVSPNVLNECVNGQMQQGSHLIYATPVLVNTTLNPIRKRKVKFTIQLTIQELLSVPYLNGVLFCKVRLCDGGHYVSYSSKKEVSNSSVLWTNDSPIQFEVKTTQFYQNSSVNKSSANESNSPGTVRDIITGYEPCLCRISVRKESRGGKSYQKIGYVDCNLTDFIYKYQLEQTRLCQMMVNNQLPADSNLINIDEFSVNRILKEYDTGSHISSKKNQQRLDNSYLKIKIKIIDTNLNQTSKQSMSNVVGGSNTNHVNISFTPLASPTNESSSSVPNSPKNTKSISPSITFSRENATDTNLLLRDLDPKKPTTQSHQVNSKNNSPELMSKHSQPHSTSPHLNNLQTFTPSHSRNSSSSTSHSILNSNNNIITQTSAFVNGHYRSCSNGSIKSNVSFDFLLKNRNKKLLEDVYSTSSSSSQVNQQQSRGISNGNGSSRDNILDQNTLQNKLVDYSSSSSSALNDYTTNKIEPPVSNIHIIETRIDVNEIINQIENELTNRLSNIKTSK